MLALHGIPGSSWSSTLRAPEENFSSPQTTPGVDLVPWSSIYYQAAAELIHAAYYGHIDAEINDQYCSLHGSLRFLHNIVRFPGCGVFEDHQSWLLRDQQTGRLVGMVLCSRVAPDVAHITQLCVAPSHRGRGLGKLHSTRQHGSSGDQARQPSP